MDCVKLKLKSSTARNNFVKDQKLCLNCLSKAHMLKECHSWFICCVDGCRQKHHTLLHNEPSDNQNGNSDNRKLTQSKLKNLRGSFSQVLPVYVTDKNGKEFKVNALLDSRSDSTLIGRTLVDKLNLLGKQHHLNLSNILNHKSTIISKLVNFSDIHPEKVYIENAWVIEHLTLPKHVINSDYLKNNSTISKMSIFNCQMQTTFRFY